ncbi:hypothetical protein C8Q76DRAFT_708889 [Earliella scabrosa]|nr:hypothetical protein C8Q76DRAFT_708889 [Earliella scabrosa]
MGGVQSFSLFRRPKPKQPFFAARHDGVVHNPLGAASYVFESELAKPLLRYLGLIPASARFPRTTADTTAQTAAGSDKGSHNVDDTDSAVSLTADTTSSTLTVHIGAQPNNSPHAGTIVTFALAFILARLFQNEYPALRARALAAGGTSPKDWVDDLRVVVQLDLVDTAPDSARTAVIDGIVYQYSHRATGAMHTFLPDYHALLEELSIFVGGAVKYTVAYQEDLMRMPAMRDALRAIIVDRERIAGELAPQREALAIRSACPVEGCGCADKHGVNNTYCVTPEKTTITFMCPTHGPYTLALEDADERARIEFNTPIRNLARAMVSIRETEASRTPRQPFPEHVHMRVTGADYAGMYQEQLFFRQLDLLREVAEPELREAMNRTCPLIVYAPLMIDWSGAKLSKSLYVKKDAYKYLDEDGMTYLLEYKRMVKEQKDRNVIFKMVEEWVQEPKKLFRQYSIYYLDSKFQAHELVGE